MALQAENFEFDPQNPCKRMQSVVAYAFYPNTGAADR